MMGHGETQAKSPGRTGFMNVANVGTGGFIAGEAHFTINIDNGLIIR